MTPNSVFLSEVDTWIILGVYSVDNLGDDSSIRAGKRSGQPDDDYHPIRPTDDINPARSSRF